ncbi:hypothetical protein D3C87_1634330 [compost metagenome]
MKTNILLFSVVLACSSLSFAAGSGSSSTYTGGTSTQTEGGTGIHPTKDGSNSLYDATINPAQSQNSLDKKTRVSTETTDKTLDTDRSGHKTDQAPTTYE